MERQGPDLQHPGARGLRRRRRRRRRRCGQRDGGQLRLRRPVLRPRPGRLTRRASTQQLSLLAELFIRRGIRNDSSSHR
ncbi:hypothetical protein C5U48_23755 [Mycolicibacter virginiensis]|uniref:Uncharacterized protein n=1 Tax=Mycolicibacter virginiensis TaxID=1795032 RepID=A0A9X7IIU3_9MYCO|nr:hypothetical protein C5U48_23755 [Mycolicibacter virginiensis]